MNHDVSWLALIGLGAFHGVNPAMGWLFAVALGMYRRSRRIVVEATFAIALGHALAIAAIVAAIMALGSFIEPRLVRHIAGAVLIGWAVYHALYGRRHRVRVGMRTGLAGLVLWSFLMASAHGAGLMLIPVLMPALDAHGQANGQAHAHLMDMGPTLAVSAAAVAVHTLATLVVTGAIALVVYEWVGVDFLRRGWINLDLLWTAALLGIGAWLGLA
jgi:hypothetical protein